MALSQCPFLAIALAGLILAACATPTTRTDADPIGAALQQPMRDLSLVQDGPMAPPLLKAAAGPYLTDGLDDCPTLARELAALDAVLGTDVDAPGAAHDGSSAFVAGLIGEVFSLPFRGVVRQVTGAQQRAVQRQSAVLGGNAASGVPEGPRQPRLPAASDALIAIDPSQGERVSLIPLSSVSKEYAPCEPDDRRLEPA